LLQDAVLSQGEPRDAAKIKFWHNDIVWFLWHSAGFLYRPTSATVQMLKLHTVRWFSQPWRKITAIAENHGTQPKSREKTTVIMNTWLSYSA